MPKRLPRRKGDRVLVALDLRQSTIDKLCLEAILQDTTAERLTDQIIDMNLKSLYEESDADRTSDEAS